MEDEQLKVVVSGSTVYKAVRNYLREDSEFKEQIQQAVIEKIISSPDIPHLLENAVRRAMLGNSSIQDEARKLFHSIKPAIDAQVRHSLDNEVRKNIKETIKDVLKDIV